MIHSLIDRLMAGVAAAAACFTVFVPTPLALAEVCASHDQVAGLLEKTHQEKRQAIGLTGGGQLLEIFVSDAGTWTAVISTPAGQSCITASGDGWESRMASLGPEA